MAKNTLQRVALELEAKAPYDRLMSGYDQLLGLEETGELPRGSAHELDVAVEHPLGVEAIGIFYWNKINPLLEQAYALIEPKTLNAPFLTK